MGSREGEVMAKKGKNKGSARSGVILLVGFLVFIGLVVVLANNWNVGVNLVATQGGAPQRDDIITLPRVVTTIFDEDGNARNVEVDAAVLVDESAVGNHNVDMLHMVVADIMNQMDHTYLDTLNDIDLVASYLHAGLEQYVPGGEILQVFITDMQSGEYRIPRPDDDGQQGRTFLENLFQGIGN